MAQQMAAMPAPVAGPAGNGVAPPAGEDWKATLKIPAKDTRIRTAVGVDFFVPDMIAALL